MKSQRSVPSHDAPVTVADRLATAFISALAALGTIAFIGFVMGVQGGDVSSRTFWWTFLQGSAVFIALAAIVGFVVGPKRAAVYWGLIWGTEKPEEHRTPVVMIALFVIVFCLMIILA